MPPKGWKLQSNNDIRILAELRERLDPDTKHQVTLTGRELEIISQALAYLRPCKEECDNYDVVETIDKLEDSLTDQTGGAYKRS